MSTPDAHPDTPPFTSDEEALAEQAIAWFARLRSEPVSLEDRQAFEAWRRQSPLHAQAYENICALWDDPALKTAAANAAHSSVPIQRKDVRRASRRWLTRFSVAAAIAGLVITASLQWDLPLRVAADHMTATGERRIVQLPDRSTVTLNTQSAIATDFGGPSRRIRLLRGEALFQVQSDRQRPFVVDNQNILTRAVGTEFVVREEPSGIRVTVVDGVVELAPNQRNWAPIQVTAGQQVTVDTNGPGMPHEIDAQAAIAWSRGRLIFDGARLADVVEELRRYHTGIIVLWNPAVGDLRVSGSYSLADPTGILTTLAQTLPIRMARLTDHVVVLF